jgi:tetratricopeptide (TPR) repeat protein
MKALPRFAGWSAACLFALAATVGAQAPPLTLPQPSPEASVSQTVGVTKMEIQYHRPAVNKRKVWGELVPMGEVWRAGANENTTISFSTPVTVEGQKVAAGTYGVHMIPGDKQWTVALSNVSSAWGSFSYDAKEDALRVTVEPRKTPFEERLEYTFEDPTTDSVTVLLRWEEVAVPIRIAVDTPALAVESIRSQMRGLPRFSWQGWNQAAAYCLANNVNLTEAIQWVDRSISMNENFTNLRTKAGLVEKSGDAKLAEDLRAKALQVAKENEINLYGYQLLGEKKYDEAIRMFQKNVKDYPKSWNTYDSLGEAYLAKGDKKLAAENYGKALAMTADDTQKKRIEGILGKMKT